MFFIMGSGRNGSTLLANLLNNHSDIFLPPETYALPYTIADWQVSFFKTWGSYCKKQLNRYLTNNQGWKLDQSDYYKIENNLKKLDKKDRGPENLLKIVFQYYSNRFDGGDKILGDHSPINTVFHKYIFYEFPTCKYIFLLRHPFDVVLSYSKIPDNPANNPLYACFKWNNSIKTYDFLKKKSYKVLLLKYEDLVSNPGDSIKKILTFIDVEYQDLIKQKSREEINASLGIGKLKHHQNLYKPISLKSVNRWERELRTEVTSKIFNLIHKNASRFGYSLKLNESNKK